MNLQISYDSSTAAAPSSFQTAVGQAVSQLDALITTPITVTIAVGWGEENGNAISANAVADNQSNATYLSQSALTKALAAAGTPGAAALPTADLSPGAKFYVPLAEQKALGLQSAGSGEVDGYVGLSSALKYTDSTTGQIAAGTFDMVSVLEHEISEVLGRVEYAGQGSSTGIYTPLDLYRYSAPGQRSLVSGSGQFSVDGQTLLGPFGNTGDEADWNAGVTGDVFGDVTPGLASHFSAADLTMLQALGYSLNTGALDSGPATAQVAAAPAPAQAATPAPLTITPARDAYVDAQGGSETFVFRPHPGDTVLYDLTLGGAAHDTLDLSQTGIGSLAAALRHTQMLPGEAVIHVTPNDMIELVGVTKADMRANPNAFAF